MKREKYIGVPPLEKKGKLVLTKTELQGTFVMESASVFSKLYKIKYVLTEVMIFGILFTVL